MTTVAFYLDHMTVSLAPFFRRYGLRLAAFLLPALALPFHSLRAQRPGFDLKLGEDSAIYLPPWNFMSLSTGGVDTFLIEHPTYDGRGVMVLIFDTGVDPSIPGLQTTSTGEPKVIDLVDVSGSNAVRFVRAEVDDEELHADGVSVRLRGFRGLQPPAADDEWWIGVIDESIYRNSNVRDFDGDGESASRFGALLYRADDGWRVALDVNADGDLSGDESVRSYRDDRALIFFPQSYGGKSPVSVGVTVDTSEKEVVFHYDMNSHGTHVAGIAAGHDIFGEEGYNGVAPGAQVISVKFSSDTADDLTVGGTMKAAFEYAAHLADSLEPLNVPVVVNMSFGIGSAYEGRAAIERFVDDLIPKHPNLYVVTSAGNEGPGLSTVGIPAAAAAPITVGALLPRGIGRDAYGAMLDGDVLWDFSSRGGEVNKPDIVAPGSAISTVPRFSFENRASGTSMASPWAAGAVAVLLSAMKQEYPGWVPTQGLVRRALRYSATPLPGYPVIEQGGGVINVRRAYQLLKKYRESGFADEAVEYRISTFAPGYPDEAGPTAFWRSGWVPTKDWRQTFSVSRVAAPDDEREFFRAYTLESTEPWLRTVQSTVYIKGTEGADIDVTYDTDRLTQPGLYTGRVLGRRAKGKSRTPADEIEFELLSTIIVPYRFSAEQGYRVTIPNQSVGAGRLRRYYFAFPPAASAARFTVSVPKRSRSVVSGWIADRYGETQNYLPRVAATEREEGSNLVPLDGLREGIVEVVVQGDPFEGSGEASEFTLSVEPVMVELDVEADDESDLKVTANNYGAEPVEGTFEYTVKGYAKTIRDTMVGAVWRAPVTMYANDGALWVGLQFSPEDYMRSTDILVRLVDSAGNAQAQEVFNTPEAWLFLPNFFDEKETGLFLEIVFGSVEAESVEPIPFEIDEMHVRPSDYNRMGGYREVIYPFVPKTFSASLPELEGGVPEGYHPIGDVRFKVDGDDDEAFEQSFEVK